MSVVCNGYGRDKFLGLGPVTNRTTNLIIESFIFSFVIPVVNAFCF